MVVNATDGKGITMECAHCGGDPCYYMCPNSPLYYSPEAERADDEAFQAEISACGGYMAYLARRMPEAFDCVHYEDDVPSELAAVYGDFDMGLGEIDGGGA